MMPTVQGFFRCNAGSLWLVIIPKSKDGSDPTSMENRIWGDGVEI
jgi:hypothetical protein